ncbi:MAG TPA: tRNA 4-thiouridine(8) synthase ThiI, partial [Spirochaetales bacterium]|nr:tRNA 4-thiouridine(8) synthase ThiI [Spirochaetales bacterium]
DGSYGVRGLPVGSTGRGLLLLSGGIDSPVAGYRMLSRGLALEALHFSSYPYTSQEAWNKVKMLAGVLAGYSGGMSLHTVSLTEFQQKLRKDAPQDRSTLYLRAGMVQAADALIRKRGLNSMVSGESLGQVASQTAENMRFTGSFTNYPILRPLVGSDKEDIIRTARSIGSYEISIQPYEDCCVLFSPRHPVLKAHFEADRERYLQLGLSDLIQEAVNKAETTDIPFRIGL